MSVVKINSYVNVSETITENEVETAALSLVNAFDNINESRFENGVITKLYYIAPVLGKILVVVNDADRDELGLASNVLANVNISEYPLVKLPAQIIDYKELIIKLGSTLAPEIILNAAQFIADEAGLKSLPYRIPVVKVIDYNNEDPSQLVMSSVFGGNMFLSTDSSIVNEGDAEAGGDVIENPDLFVSSTITCPTDGSVSVGDIYEGHLVVGSSELKDMIDHNQDVTEVCTSLVTNMSKLFYSKDVWNQDISKWDVSNVTTMYRMFYGAKIFEGDISEWDVSSVLDMHNMFRDATKFNSDISQWDVSNVTSMERMFNNAQIFNQDISIWNVDNVTSFDYFSESYLQAEFLPNFN